MTFPELLQQLVTLSQTIATDSQLSNEERAALTLVGYERFDRLTKETTIHQTLVKEN